MNPREKNTETEVKGRAREEEAQAALDSLKEDINELLFRSLPPETTLQEMEMIATDWYSKITRLWEHRESICPLCARLKKSRDS